MSVIMAIALQYFSIIAPANTNTARMEVLTMFGDLLLHIEIRLPIVYTFDIIDIIY